MQHSNAGADSVIGTRNLPYCTLALTEAFALSVNVQVSVLLPPLEQAPDQTTSRPFVALSVIAVPVANNAEPLLPTLTLMPTGLDMTRSPLRPVAVTVNVTFALGGFTVRAAVRVTPPALAVIVTSVDVVTALVAIGKVVLVAPGATDTLAGTVAAAVLLDSDTTAPPVGAAALKVTVPVEELPPWTVAGDSDSAESAAGGGAALPFTVSVAVCEIPLAEAVMVVVRVVAATRVEIGKVPLLNKTVVVAGTVAAAVFELVSETTKPPVGAPSVRKIVPVALAPPSTVAGDTNRDAGPTGGGGAASGVTLSVALRVAPPKAAVMVASVDAVTDTVLTVNGALRAPAATVALAGTVATLRLLLDSVTSAPPAGAVLVSVAVPCTVLPPTTLAALSAIAESAGTEVEACGVKRRVAENGPNTPAEFRARTRHHKRCAGRPPMLAWETLTIWLAMKGAEMVELSSTWIS